MSSANNSVSSLWNTNNRLIWTHWVRAKKLTEFGIWNRTLRNRIRHVSDFCQPQTNTTQRTTFNIRSLRGGLLDFHRNMFNQKTYRYLCGLFARYFSWLFRGLISLESNAWASFMAFLWPLFGATVMRTCPRKDFRFKTFRSHRGLHRSTLGRVLED